MSTAPASPASRQYRILVVDDDAGMRALCAALLESEGYAVIEARDGREALARAATDRPDLVVCDVAMPVLDGFGFAVALRASARLRNIPVVFLTGETAPEVAFQALDVGALGCFAKPLVPGVLSTFIGSVLSRASSVAPAPFGRQAA